MVALLPPPAPAYDLAQLRRLAQGRAPFVSKIIRSFLANAPTSLAELRAAAAAHDWLQVARVVHHIKPNLLALGITRPAAAVALLTARPAESDPAWGPDARAQALAGLLAAVEQALNELPRELLG
jgi:HPt (histidine-containing phosphotransfer) domain-containing protein